MEPRTEKRSVEEPELRKVLRVSKILVKVWAPTGDVPCMDVRVGGSPLLSLGHPWGAVPGTVFPTGMVGSEMMVSCARIGL